MGSYTAPPIRVGPRPGERAELVFGGIEQAGPSFEGRVFLNNPSADQSTAKAPETGYAGSFHVYGYGSPPPPAIAEEQANRGQGAGPVAPIEKRLRADDAVVSAALAGSGDLTVTVVPVPVAPGGPTPERPFEDVEVVFDRAGP
jgi:hypothetical protein